MPRLLLLRLALVVPVGAAGLAASARADDPIEVVTVQSGSASGAGPDAPSAQPANATEPGSVVNRAALDRYVAPTGNYDDALRLTPSVLDVSPNGPGLGEAQVLTIRGFADGQYDVSFDGIPFADSDDFTHHSSAYFTVRDLAGVTVDRGPGDATTIGDATFGGSVALRSVAPSATGGVSPTESVGSFATRSGGLLLESGTGGLAGGASGVLDAEAVQSDGALDGAAQRRGTLFGKLLVPLGPGMTLTLAGNLARTVQNEPPGATRAEIAASGPSVALNADPRSQAYEGYNSSAYRTDLSYAALSAEPVDGTTLSDTVYSYGLDRHFEQGLDPNGETPDGTAFGAEHVPGQSGRNGLRAWGNVLRAVRRLPDGWSAEAGLWAERQANARSLVEIDLTAGGIANPVLAPVAGVPGSAAIDRLQQESLLTLQPYAQLDWQMRPWLRLTAGLKGAWFDRAVSAPVMEGTRLSTAVDRGFGAVLPALAVHAGLGSGWSVYAQGARGFLAPPLQLFDVTDPRKAALSPEETWNVQLGTVWRRDGLLASADVYEILFDNTVGVRTVGGESLDFAEGRVKYRGLEMEATQALGSGVSLYASGSLNRAHQSGGVGGTSGPAPATPQATLGAGLIVKRGRVEASLVDRWTGGSFGDVEGSQWIAPYNQLDLSAGTTLRVDDAAPVALKAQVFNLLDSRRIDGLAGYTVAQATPLFWTQAGRSVSSAQRSGSDRAYPGGRLDKRCGGEHSCRSRVALPHPKGAAPC